MADDIVTRLRKQQWQHHSRSNTFTALADAADEIERLRAEADASRLIIRDLTAAMERLRAAGDALADALERRLNRHQHDAIDAWQEARREH